MFKVMSISSLIAFSTTFSTPQKQKVCDIVMPVTESSVVGSLFLRWKIIKIYKFCGSVILISVFSEHLFRRIVKLSTWRTLFEDCFWFFLFESYVHHTTVRVHWLIKISPGNSFFPYVHWTFWLIYKAQFWSNVLWMTSREGDGNGWWKKIVIWVASWPFFLLEDWRKEKPQNKVHRSKQQNFLLLGRTLI